jgi:hypothetical protein
MKCSYRKCSELLAEPRNPRRIYCSQRCGQAEQTQKLTDARRARPDYAIGMTVECANPECAKPFASTTHNRRYCSRDCYRILNNKSRKKRECRICKANLAGRSKRVVYCSLGCSVQGKEQLRKASLIKKTEEQSRLIASANNIKECQSCGDLIVVRSGSQRFCRFCREAARRAVVKNVSISDAVRVWSTDTCAGCSLPFDESKKGLSAVLDHDHKTQAVRGKLHSNCNLAIGLVSEDPVRLIRLSLYLQDQARNDVS